MADIPGLIEGAAAGAGLGVAFLKHLARTRLLLHLLDIAPIDGSNPIDNCRLIEQELAKYSTGIAAKPRWLVFTKLDMMPPAAAPRNHTRNRRRLGAYPVLCHLFRCRHGATTTLAKHCRLYKNCQHQSRCTAAGGPMSR